MITNNKKSGMTLVELLMVVGIGGAIIAGALMFAKDVNNKREIKTHSENISAIFSNMQNLFADEPVDPDMPSLITAGVFPNSLKQTATTVTTMGGGNVEIVANGPNGFILKYPKITADSCVEVLKAQKRVGWDDWAVKAGNASEATATNQYSDSSVSSVPKLATACKTTQDWVSLTFARN